MSKRPLDSSSESEYKDEAEGKRNVVRCKGPVRFLEDSEDDKPKATAGRYSENYENGDPRVEKENGIVKRRNSWSSAQEVAKKLKRNFGDDYLEDQGSAPDLTNSQEDEKKSLALRKRQEPNRYFVFSFPFDSFDLFFVEI